ncbi:hypothetical protein BT96DRAFT_915173 [Gymnopus androsaceus JB14]|uniref:Uncharacterized protein n=1 Tax=Gymnopus androsaceus JB14 TaxID=1447944 RepID=A0A6A4I4C7_9AGAR|nr:hypothetical protein BT96DRAFT_915173 [Gymnopus androsaceus JB14]
METISHSSLNSYGHSTPSELSPDRTIPDSQATSKQRRATPVIPNPQLTERVVNAASDVGSETSPPQPRWTREVSQLRREVNELRQEIVPSYDMDPPSY